MERRRYIRVNSKTEIHIYNGRDAISGYVNNISAGGLFFETSKEFYENQILNIVIIIANNGSHLSLKTMGVVIRTDESGIAIEFTDLDMDTFILLNKYINESIDYAV